MIGVILAAALLGYLILLLFEVKKIEVKGTVYTSEQEVLDWVQEDKYSSNSLYILWKYGSKETSDEWSTSWDCDISRRANSWTWTFRKNVLFS